jgi:hypothetical protein
MRYFGRSIKRLPAPQRKIATRLAPTIGAKVALRTANAMKKTLRRPVRRAGYRPAVRRPVGRAAGYRRPIRRPGAGYAAPAASNGQVYGVPSAPVGQSYGVSSAPPVPINQVVAGAAARPIVETMASPARRQYVVRRNRAWAQRFRVSGTVSFTPY